MEKILIMVNLFKENIKPIDMIPIYKPYLPNYITKYAHDAINSTWIEKKN